MYFVRISFPADRTRFTGVIPYTSTRPNPQDMQHRTQLKELVATRIQGDSGL